MCKRLFALMQVAVNGCKEFADTEPFHLLLRELQNMLVSRVYVGLRTLICQWDSANLPNC